MFKMHCSSVLIAASLFFMPLTALQAGGCCSHHSGPGVCNKNVQMCKDGSVSSCSCDKVKKSAMDKNKALKNNTKVEPQAKTTPVPVTKSTKVKPEAQGATTKPRTQAKPSGKTMSGCCSHHQGVASCMNGATVRKDGSKSSCKCN